MKSLYQNRKRCNIVKGKAQQITLLACSALVSIGIFASHSSHAQSSNLSATDPVWAPYRIADIIAPYKNVAVTQWGWKGLHLLSGKGGLFSIAQYQSYAEKDGAIYRRANENDIYFALVIEGGAYIDTFLNNTNIQDSKLNEFSRILWKRGNGGKYYSTYGSLLNYGKNDWVSWHSEVQIRVCNITLHPGNQSSALRYEVLEYTGDKLAFSEQNGHTPYPQNVAGFLEVCANGGTITDANKFKLRRLVSSGTNTLQPYRFYKLDQASNHCDFQGRSCGTASGTTFFGRNDGKPNGATYFNLAQSDAKIQFPLDVMNEIKNNEDFTISFWMQGVRNTDLVENDYPAQSDTWLSALYAFDYDSMPVLGVVLNKNGGQGNKSTGHIGLMRQTPISFRTIGGVRPWVQWLADPVRIRPVNDSTNDKPWVYVVLVVQKNRTQIYTYMPDQWGYSTSVKDRVTLTRFNFLTSDNDYLNQITSWGIGASNPTLHKGSFKPISAMSDLALFREALSESQVRDVINAGILHDVPGS